MKKILYIEDEMHLRKMLADLMRQAGFEVFEAPDGELGIKIMTEEKPNLVLLDLILPKKDGFEGLSEIRKNEETKNIPVVVLTNLEEKFDIERTMSYNVCAYWVKTNYKPEEIVEKVKEILK